MCLGVTHLLPGRPSGEMPSDTRLNLQFAVIISGASELSILGQVVQSSVVLLLWDALQAIDFAGDALLTCNCKLSVLRICATSFVPSSTFYLDNGFNLPDISSAEKGSSSLSTGILHL